MRPLTSLTTIRAVILGSVLLATAAGCGGGQASPVASSPLGSGVVATQPSPSSGPADTASPTDSAPSPDATQEPDTGTGTTSGDVPDNAVFLRYKDLKLGFSIQYVEGWQVTPDPSGVTIRDKDSSEIVQIVPAQTDVAGYVSSTDLPALQAQAGFKLVKQDKVKVGSQTLIHLVYDILSPADSVTGKQVPQTVDRYFVPGTNGLAVVSLATPKGVDNVDAFRQMIESLRWA
jgi:hypothetical protein